MRDPGLIACDHEDDDKEVDLLLTYRRRAVDTVRTARTLTDRLSIQTFGSVIRTADGEVGCLVT
jgi:hypothetical protein